MKWNRLILLVVLILFVIFADICCSSKDIIEDDIIKSIKDLDNKEWPERVNAMFRLESLGKQMNAAVPKLISALNDDNVEVRRNAAEALGAMGKGSEIVRALGSVLKLEDNDNVRIAASRSLSEIGFDSKEVLDQLLESINDRNWWVRVYVIGALGKIGPEPGVVEALISALDDGGGAVGRAASESLKLFGKAAKPAVGKLRALGYDDAADSIEHDAEFSNEH